MGFLEPCAAQGRNTSQGAPGHSLTAFSPGVTCRLMTLSSVKEAGEPCVYKVQRLFNSS